MFPQMLPMVLAPLLGLLIVSVGNGFLFSLTTLRLEAAGTSDAVIGLVSSAHFIGLALGALFHDRLIMRIGHIRAYGSFASLIVVSVLLQGMYFDPWLWFMERLLYGWATVGIYLVIESWLLLASDQKNRGQILAFYMVALYGSTVIGQAALGAISGSGDTFPFMLAGVLAALSVLPIVILPKVTPLINRAEPLRVQDLMRITQSGVIGALGSGIAIAAIYALLPLYLQRIGMSITEVGSMMAVLIMGAMILQYPIGRWSDRKDRRVVLICLSIFCAILSGIILFLPPGSFWLLPVLFLLGGAVFAIYPVAVSHSADGGSPDSLVQIIQGLLLINSAGSAISPFLVSIIMAEAGASGFFGFFVVLHVLMVIFFSWRRGAKAAPSQNAPFAPGAAMSPVGAELRVSEEMIQGAIDSQNEEDEQAGAKERQ